MSTGSREQSGRVVTELFVHKVSMIVEKVCSRLVRSEQHQPAPGLGKRTRASGRAAE